MVPRKQKAQAGKSKLTTLNVKFWGPFGFCVYNHTPDRYVDVRVPDLPDHDYWAGTWSAESPHLDPLPKGNGSGLREVDPNNYVEFPDEQLALVVDAQDNDIGIQTINHGRNALRLPCPTVILLESIYKVSGIFTSKSKLGASRRINKRQRFIPDKVTFVYSLSNNRVPTFDLGAYHWKPSDLERDTADLYFVIGPQQEEIRADDPAKDFSDLVALFPNLDLAAKKFPLKYHIMNPPYHCRATALFVDNPPSDRMLPVRTNVQRTKKERKHH